MVRLEEPMHRSSVLDAATAARGQSVCAIPLEHIDRSAAVRQLPADEANFRVRSVDAKAAWGHFLLSGS